ncbi:MAG: prolipoprotein diacylglyceryl transferase [Candidatus Omnitrophica bacterium]|nr:prolipoprotein diacylglyceryl transferase [Candidatus Omnitrophota bacterium]
MKSILLSLGPFHLYSYGLMMVLGVMLSLFWMKKQIERDKFCNKNTLYDMVFFCVISGLVGARLYYVIQNGAWYRVHPWNAFAVWEGGLVFYGGLISSTLGLLFFFRAKKIPPLAGFDFMIPYVALTQTFGRIGCFLNGCCFGAYCSFPWAVSFPGGPEHVHPAQIYESLYTFLLFIFLSAFYPRRNFPGQIFGLYLILYGLGRLAIEFFRDGNPMWFFLTWNQWISLGVIAGGAMLIVKERGEGRGKSEE